MTETRTITALSYITKALTALHSGDYHSAIDLAHQAHDADNSPATLKRAQQIIERARKKLPTNTTNTSSAVLPPNSIPKKTEHSRSEHNQNLSSACSKIILGYCVLLMEAEKEVTLLTLSNLLQQIDTKDHVFVLFNGFEDKALKVHIEKHSGITCWQSSANLGVATGRNFLYSHILNNEPKITHIVTLDNDVLLPNDLNSSIKKDVITIYKENNIGVMGAVILDYKREKTRNYIKENFLPFKGYLSADCFNVFSDDMLDYLKGNQKALKQVLWHIGMHQDYRRVYIDRSDLSAANHGSEKFQSSLAHSDKAALMLKQRFFEVSNVPGCFQVFSTDHLRNSGLLEDRFSPYFFEDSEFCIRSIQAGKKNIISTTLVLMHGTDSRHHDRKEGNYKFRHLVNEYRARYILFKSLEEPDAISKLLEQARRTAELRSETPPESKTYQAALEGLMKGVNQYHNDAALMDRKILEKEIADEEHSSVYLEPTASTIQHANQITFLPSLPKKDEPLPRIYFQRLKKFRNLYKDEDCLIICNGPSLKNTRLGLFAGMPTFAVNSTFILQETLGFEPTFYTIEDNHVVTDNLAQILALKAGVKFFPEKYREFLGDSRDIFYLPTNWDCYFKSKVSYEYPEFSKDIARSIYTGQTVTYLNLQIAYFMGFKRVFIVGLDFSYSIPKNARVEHNSIDHDEDDPNHFHPSYFGKGKQWHFPKLDSCMTSYSIAREAFEREGREIIDLTLGGRLNVFKKEHVINALGLTNDIPELKEGLSLTQYLIDYAVVSAARFRLKYRFIIQEIQTDIISDDKLVQIIACKDTETLNRQVNNLINNQSISASNYCLIFPRADLIIVTSEFSFISRMPFFAWADTSLNVSYVNVSASFAGIKQNVYPYLISRADLIEKNIVKQFLKTDSRDAVMLLVKQGLYVKM